MVPSKASKPAEIEKDSLPSDASVPEKAVKRPVWNIDTIPQLDGSPEPSENTKDDEPDAQTESGPLLNSLTVLRFRWTTLRMQKQR